MQNYDYSRLHSSLVGVIQEAQTKIGYDRHAITFYYPASSVAHMLGTAEDADAVERALRGFAAFAQPTLGAVEVVRDMIPEASLAGVHIYFPDPWRKARHHKRRLVAQPFIGMLASRIRPGGYIHCATDWENYAEQMLEVLEGEPQLENLHGAGNFSPVMGNPITERPTTKFQARGERLGHGIWDLVYIRK